MNYHMRSFFIKEMEIQFGKVFDELGINLDEAFNGTMLPPVREFDEVVENAKNTLKDSEIPAISGIEINIRHILITTT